MNVDLKRETVVSKAVAPTGANGPVVFTSTGDKFIFTTAMPIEVIRWGIVYSVAKDASNMVATLSLRPTSGSDTARAVISTLTDALARAQGVVTYQEPGTLTTAAATQSVAEDGSLRNVDPVGPYQVLPGQELVAAVTTAAGSTGQGVIFIEYRELPFSGTPISAATVVKLAAST